MTGHRADIASNRTNGEPSLWEGRAKMSAAFSRGQGSCKCPVKTTLAAISPGLVRQRIKPAPWLDFADALEIFCEHALLGFDLRGNGQML